MTARAAFRQDDVTRVCKGIRSAGLKVGTVVVQPDGTITATIGDPAIRGAPDDNPWDDDLHAPDQS